MTTDPFEILREPVAPVAPRSSFSADLRRRVARALGVASGDPGHAPAIREYTPARLHSLTPYLCCTHADRAIDWYQRVFDAQLLGDPIVMPDGHVGHAELRFGDMVVMLADEYPDEAHLGPDTLGGSSTAFQLYVPDADETYERAVAHGATPLRPLAEAYGSRQGTLRDPFGHRWFICTHLEADDATIEDVAGRRLGDIGYMTLEVRDGDRARRFYEGLFGWTFAEGHEEGSFHISSITPPAGVHGGQEQTEVRLYFRVDDIEAAATRVRELGGEVLTVTDYDSGGNAECVDDQGLRFDLFRPRPGY
ncbi:MAG TPA: VOC family protein [Acidimicrobiales bacterium]|jgi:uncharacterized glyoxalase superfamily protein PhnB|nr:VOC family protein [Acidimicrobiales bacterium]